MMDVKKFMAEEAKEHAHKGLKRPMSHKTKKVHKKAKAARYKSVPKAKRKIEKTLHEFKEGALHTGSKKGPIVKSRKQALAIAINQARQKGAKIPKKHK
jgi:hypothetical protein